MKMKNCFYSVLAIMMATMLSVSFCSCGSDDGDDDKKPEPPTPTLTVSGVDALFAADASSMSQAQEMKIKTNSTWVITGKPDWLEITPMSGDGDATVKIWPNQPNNTSENKEATIVVQAGDKSVPKTITQRAGIEKDCYAQPSEVLSLINDVACNFTCGSNTKFFYVRAFVTSALSRYTDEELINSVKSENNRWDRTTYSEASFPACFGAQLDANSSYTIVTVSYSNSDKIGDVIKYEVKTKPTANQPLVEITNVSIGTKNNKPVYGLTVKKGQNGYCEKYYVWGAAGSTLSCIDVYPAIKCWYLNKEIKAEAISHATNINYYLDKILQSTTVGREYLHGPLSQEESISSDLAFSNDDKYLDVLAWGVDVDGKLSGYVANSSYTLNSSTSSPMKVQKRAMQAPSTGSGYRILQKP